MEAEQGSSSCKIVVQLVRLCESIAGQPGLEDNYISVCSAACRAIASGSWRMRGNSSKGI